MHKVHPKDIRSIGAVFFIKTEYFDLIMVIKPRNKIRDTFWRINT